MVFGSMPWQYSSLETHKKEKRHLITIWSDFAEQEHEIKLPAYPKEDVDYVNESVTLCNFRILFE